jgi:hypothetical protein
MATNPTPRPALRKAPDASVHPAAPVVGPADPPAVVEPSARAASSATPRPTHLRPVVGLGGVTSDGLRKAPEEKKSKKGKGQAKTKTKGKVDKESKKAAKVHMRRVDLKVKVPKEVRQALRTNAKARGTSVDDVVTNVLQGWLHG